MPFLWMDYYILPVQCPFAVNWTALRIMTSAMRPATRHIIYVDDDKEDRDVFLESLSLSGREVRLTVMDSGQELLRYLEPLQPSELPSAIISDMKMPQMDGIDLLRKIKGESRWQHIPVFIFSTSSSVVDRELALRHGAIKLLSKPVHFNDIGRIITDILDYTPS